MHFLFPFRTSFYFSRDCYCHCHHCWCTNRTEQQTMQCKLIIFTYNVFPKLDFRTMEPTLQVKSFFSLSFLPFPWSSSYYITRGCTLIPLCLSSFMFIMWKLCLLSQSQPIFIVNFVRSFLRCYIGDIEYISRKNMKFCWCCCTYQKIKAFFSQSVQFPSTHGSPWAVVGMRK